MTKAMNLSFLKTDFFGLNRRVCNIAKSDY